jgi:hypothetical protein
MELHKNAIFLLVSSILLNACAGGAQPDQTPIAATPTCSNPAECDAKWAAARSFVLSHSGYKFQTYTNDFMDTFNPSDGAVQLGAQVNREPQPDGTTRIVAKFWCDNIFGCSPPVRQTLDQFNQALNAVKAGI